MTSAGAVRAEGGGGIAMSRFYTGSDNEDEGVDSTILADLTAMFPAVQHDELVTVLRSHGGDVDATVDYLMALSLQIESQRSAGLPPGGYQRRGQASADEQVFSDDIGGLPEVLPSFMTGNQTDSDSDDDTEEEDAPANQRQSTRNRVNSDEDPLPTYEEAMMDDGGYSVAGAANLGVSIEGQPPSAGHHHRGEKKRKRKKLGKLAGKLNIKKKSSRAAIGKSEGQERRAAARGSVLLPLIDGDELEVERASGVTS